MRFPLLLLALLPVSAVAQIETPGTGGGGGGGGGTSTPYYGPFTNTQIYGTTTNALRLSSGVITSSLPAIDISQTWSNSGVTFTGLRVNVTNLASASATLLADFQTNGTSHFFVAKDGLNYLGGILRNGGTALEFYPDYATARARSFTYRVIMIGQESSVGISLAANYPISWSANASGVGDCFLNRDTQLFRDAAATLQLGADAATATAQTLKAHDGSGTDKAGADLSINGGQGTGSGVGGTLNFKTAPAGSTGSSLNSYVTRMSIDHTGKVTAPFLATSNLLYLPVALASPAATVTIDLAGGSMQYVTMTNDTTIALTNSAAGRNVSVFFVGPTNNQYKLIMPSSIRLYSGAVTNTITTNKSAVVSFTSFDGISTNLVTTVAIEP